MISLLSNLNARGQPRMLLQEGDIPGLRAEESIGHNGNVATTSQVSSTSRNTSLRTPGTHE